ncbi:restriction endonuclease [Nostoc sp. 3335mG]|nr:restriction endonuclease [Nostoc sp. 3335mG]
MNRSGALRYFATIKNGTTPASGEPTYWDGDVAWATPDDLGQLTGSYIAETKRRVTPLAVNENNLNLVPADTVLMSTRAPIGHMAITGRPMTFNQGCRALIPHAETWGPYLLYLLKSRVPELNASANGTTFVELSRDELAAVRVTLPPLETQRRIAAFLDDKTAQIDALIARKQALLARLAEKRQAIITQAVTKGLNPAAPLKDSGIGRLGQIPAHWNVTRLDRLNDYRRPIRYGIVLPGPHYEGGVPIIKGGDVRPDRLKRELLNCTDPEIDAANPRARVSAGDLVYTIRGSFGDVEIASEELAGCNLTQDTARISPLPEVDAHWLLMALKSSAVRGNLAAGSLGATIKGINIFDLRRALIPTPPLSEQRQIATHLAKWRSDLDGLSEKVERSLGRLTEYRSALITSAVTGQIEGLR